MYIYGCKSKFKVRNKVQDRTRSVPLFDTPVPYLLEGSVPYSIHLHTYIEHVNLFYIYIHIHERKYSIGK